MRSSPCQDTGAVSGGGLGSAQGFITELDDGAGGVNLKALNPYWDDTFIGRLPASDLDAIDGYTTRSKLDRPRRRAVHGRADDITYRCYRPINGSSFAPSGNDHRTVFRWSALTNRPRAGQT